MNNDLKLVTNSNINGDFLKYEFLKYAKNSEILIACPFFSDDKLLIDAMKKNCNIKLIVRLCLITNPKSLREILKYSSKIQIRYFTDVHFHSKLYIMGNEIAFVGSSNCTGGGMVSNQEINIGINSDNPIFEDLKLLFDNYWEYSNPFSANDLKDYEAIIHHYNDLENKEKSLNDDIINRFNEVSMGKKKLTHLEEDIIKFKKNYQVFIQKHKILEEIYISQHRRKLDESTLPLRLEIDQFLNWIREKKAKKETRLDSPIRKEPELNDFVSKEINEFINSQYDLSETIKRYNNFKRNFQNVNTIDRLNIEELYETLFQIHSFRGRERYFYEDGISKMKEIFLSTNSKSKIINFLKYLLFENDDDYKTRIAKCIFDDNFGLNHFKESAVKELYGWVNNDNIPLCNNRTLRSMQWLGFGKLI